MKIALYSDCHTEMRQDFPWFPNIVEGVDVIVLAGDIGVGGQAIVWIEALSVLHPSIDIIFVAGNHEYYRTHLHEQIERYRAHFANNPKIHFLENASVLIRGIRFLGCTLWTDFKALGEERSKIPDTVFQYLADFHLIEIAESRFIRPEDMASMQKESVYWLREELKAEFKGKTVVITHFPPTNDLFHGIIGDNVIAPYFLNDLENVIQEYCPVLWCYGHNHWNADKQVGNTRVVSNQLGYPSEDSNLIGFKERFALEI